MAAALLLSLVPLRFANAQLLQSAPPMDSPFRPTPLLPALPSTPAPVTAPLPTGPLTLQPGLALPNVIPPLVASPPMQPAQGGRPVPPPERQVGTGQGYMFDGWLIVPSVDLRQSFTDNAFETRNKRADTYTTISPNITVSRQGANNQIYLSYSFQADKYWDHDQLDRIQHDLTEFSHTGLIRDWLYFDTSAVVRQQPLTSFGSLTPSTLQRNNTTEEIGFSVSPYLRHRFGSIAESELRYNYSQVNYGSNNLADARTNQVLWNTLSGDSFTRLQWATQLSYTNSEREGSFLFVNRNLPLARNPAGDSTYAIAQANFEYVVTREVGLLFGGGYESIEDPTLAHNIHDALWNVGFHLRPGPRTDLRVLYGRQYGQTVFTGAARYELSAATRVTARLINDLQSSQSLLQQNLLGLDVDEYGNPVTGADRQLFQTQETLLGISQATFRRRRAEIDLRTVIGRSSFNPQIYFERRKTDITNARTTASGVVLLYSRDLAPDLLGSASFSYQHVTTEPGSTRDNNFYGSLSLIYSLTPVTGLYGSFTHLTRNSNIASGDLDENLFVIGVRRYF